MPKTIVFDVELLAGRFLFKGIVLENRKVITIWGQDPDAKIRLREVMESGCLFVSFNGNRFDLPIMSGFLSGLEFSRLKRMANAIIVDELQPWHVSRMYNIPELKIDHIDLIEVAPSFVGLKTYGARMHMPWLKDLPFAHDVESLTEEEFEQVDRYCENDLVTTEELYRRLAGAINLRIQMSKEYDVDLRSKSDTQMAETSFIKRLNLNRTRAVIPETIRYEMPSFISFDSPHLQELAQKIQDHEYVLNQNTGHVINPDFLSQPVLLNKGSYQMGVGGIHSTHDKKVCYVASKDFVIADIDAASYYPSIIINCNLIPKNTGQKFIDEYSRIYHRRLEAKKTGDKATNEVLKISLNGTFGKTASRWSPLYSPDLALAITLTGQLTLLSLIEKLESIGAMALSANTDGIAIGASPVTFEQVKKVVKWFEGVTKFEFEYAPYRVLAMKDVNSYFAVKSDRSIKTKGIYAEQSLSKNPNAQVCSDAVGKWLAFGIPFEDTIRASSIEGFISARSVTGGGVQGDNYLGKVVRWYQTIDRSLPPITYGPGKKEGDKVPKTDGSRACMILPDEIPEDLDFTWYLQECFIIAHNCGCSQWLDPVEVASAFKSRKKKVPK